MRNKGDIRGLDTERLKSITVKIAYATTLTSIIAVLLGLYVYMKVGRPIYLVLTPFWIAFALYSWRVSRDLKRA